MDIEAKGLDHKALNEAIRAAGPVCRIRGCMGQRFIGAGMIIYRKTLIRGLTTAAGVWATAGVGMAAGSGLYIVAVGSTALLIIVQCIMHLNFKLFKTKKYLQLRVKFEEICDESETVKRLFAVERFARITAAREDGKLYYDAIITTDREFSVEYIAQILVERCDED